MIGRDSTDGRVVTRRADGTGHLVGEVAHHRAAVVAAAREPIIDLAGGSVAIVIGGRVLVAGKDFLSVAIGIEVAHMLGVAMSEAGSTESLAVVVDDHRAEADLVASVPVDISNRIVVVSLPVPGTARRVAVPAPACGELVCRRIHVEGNHLVAGVDTAGEEDAGLVTVEIRSAEEVLRAAVAVAVAPGLLQVGLAVLESFQRIVHIIRMRGGAYLIGLTGLSVEVEQILGTGVHKELRHGTVLTVSAIVFRLVTDDNGLTRCSVENGTVGGTHDAFCLAVAVPVIGGNVGLVVLEVTEVGAAVDPPKQLSVEFKHLDAVEVGTVGFVFGIISGADLLDDELHLAVAVYIGDGGIVGLIDIGDVGLSVVGEALGLGNLQIVIRQHGSNLGTGSLFYSFYYRAYGIGAAGATGRVGEIRYGERLVVDLYAIAVKIICDIVVFLGVDTPGTKHAIRRLHGDKTSVELIGHTLCMGFCGQEHGQQTCQDVFLSHRIMILDFYCY